MAETQRMVLSYLMTKDISLREVEDDLNSAMAGIIQTPSKSNGCLWTFVRQQISLGQRDLFALIHLNINLNALISGRG